MPATGLSCLSLFLAQWGVKILAATIRHPWNADICEEEDVLCARDWSELERKLGPILSRKGAGVGTAK